MKKVGLIFLACIMVLTLFACSGKVETTTKPGTTTETKTTTKEEPKYRIGFTISERDTFFTSYETALNKAATAAGNITVTSFDAQGDVQKQYEHIDTFVTQKYDCIVISAVNTDTITEMLKMAGNVPVIIAFRFPAGVEDLTTILRKGDATVGSDNIIAAQEQANYLIDYFTKKGQTEISYVLLTGDLGSEVTKTRSEGVKQFLKDAGFKLNCVLEQPTNWERAESMSIMQTMLGTQKKFDCVICNCDEIALGAIEAMKASNVTPGLNGIPVLGIDATEPGNEAVAKGEMNMTVLLDPVANAEKTIEVFKAMVSGKDFEPVNWIGWSVVTKENVDKFK